MCLLVGRIAEKQHSGVPEVSPEAYTCPETDYDTSQSVHGSGHEKYTCSNEEDDRNHRQCQWKRIRRDSEEFPGVCLGGTKRYTGGDNQGNGPSPGEKGYPCVSNSNQQCQSQRIIFQKDGVHDKDAGRKRSSDGTYAWERGNGYKGLRRNSDGGATYNEVESRAVKRKYEASVDGRRSPRVMYGSCKVAREKHMARMLWANEATHGHETRVVGREFEGLDGDNQTPFLNDCPSSHDLCISIKERPRKSSNRQVSLDGKMGRANTMSLENGDYQGGHGSSVGVNELQVRSGKRAHEVHVGNGRVSARAASESVDRKVTSSGGSPRPSHDSCKSFENTGMGAENARLRKNGEEEKGRDMLKDRGRTRWADKERDLEKENLPKGEPKSVTVVDYSHVFAVTAPASVQEKPVEADPHRLCQRQKQIDYGKNTLGYERFMDVVPRYQRKKEHPRTPDIRQVCSKRSWDGQIRKWRRLLHEYDPPKGDDEEDPDELFVAARDGDSQKSSTPDDTVMGSRSEVDRMVGDLDLKIYDEWSDEDC